ncbi:TRAP transporter substrate-binding protein [Lacibacterium aquatile]|uniref:TRAP transporter substrate-binding protein n=1 Tax=Lacibacterium aquatile TaxID=1168082 RepID=A0ABW5DJW5_9PROT
MKRTIISLGVAAVALMAALPAAAEIKPRIIRFGYGLNEDSLQGRGARHFAEELAKATGDKHKVRTFGAATLGSDMQMQNALAGGAQEMMVGSTATLVGLVKEFGVWDLPFLFNNEKEADAVLDGPFGQKLLDKLAEKDLIGLVYWENGFRNMTNTKRPINSVEDLKGIKLRVMQNPVFLDVFNGVGANAVPLAFSELFSALETKAVDGQENPVTTIESSKFYEVQKYLSLTKHVYSPWIMMASKTFWDKLDADEKAAIMKAAVSSREFERKDSRESTEKSMVFLKSKGMQINEVSAAETDRMRAAVKPILDKVKADIGAATIAELDAEIAKVRK